MYTASYLAAMRATVLDPRIEGGMVRSRITNDPGGDTFAGSAGNYLAPVSHTTRRDSPIS